MLRCEFGMRHRRRSVVSAQQADNNGSADFVLVVNPENNARLIDFNDRRTAVLFGDASSAMVVSTRVPSRAVIRCQPPQSAPGDWTKIVCPSKGHIRQDGRAAQAFAIRTISSLLGGLGTEGDRSENAFFIGPPGE